MATVVSFVSVETNLLEHSKLEHIAVAATVSMIKLSSMLTNCNPKMSGAALW